jgi:hypothetical protein
MVRLSGAEPEKERKHGGSAIQGGHADAFQNRDDLARDFVGLIGGVMEFDVRDGPGGCTDIFAIHADRNQLGSSP